MHRPTPGTKQSKFNIIIIVFFLVHDFGKQILHMERAYVTLSVMFVCSPQLWRVHGLSLTDGAILM